MSKEAMVRVKVQANIWASDLMVIVRAWLDNDDYMLCFREEDADCLFRLGNQIKSAHAKLRNCMPCSGDHAAVVPQPEVP